MVNYDRLYTDRYSNIAELCLGTGTLYFYHKNIEERSTPADNYVWQKSTGAQFIDVNVIDAINDIAEIVTSHQRFSLRSEDQIIQILTRANPSNIYLDASGMSVRVFAPLLKCAISVAKTIKARIYVVYVEPRTYDIKKFKEGGLFYDLAEGFNGLSPLPTLGSILPVRGKSALVPMLGFEGGRFAHVLNQLPSEDDLIIPIVGVCGYRPEYPFVTYWGNKRPLEDTESWASVEYAMAGSIVDAFLGLARIRNMHKDIRHWKIAPIGTKPHTIAALLFAILNPFEAEIVYDNPTRKEPRTAGLGCVSATCISDLIAGYCDA